MTIMMNHHCPTLHRSFRRTMTATARNIKPINANSPSNQVVTILDPSLSKSNPWDGRSISSSIPRCRTPYPFSDSSLTRTSSFHPSSSAGSYDKSQDDRITLERALEGTMTRVRRVPLKENTDSVLNLWQPSPLSWNLCRTAPMIKYDINSKLPFHILKTDHVRLEPFVPSMHLAGLMALPKESWDLLGHMGPFPNADMALEEIENWRKDPRSLMLAAIDLRREANGQDAFAGIYGLMEYNQAPRNILFGCINVLPRYRRTHINTHAMYLLLQFLFDELKLLRVQYDAVEHNTASISAAKRFGFKPEGILRNLNGVVPKMKRRDGEEWRMSQNLWVSSMTDLDWDTECREKLRKMVEKPPVDTTVL